MIRRSTRRQRNSSGFSMLEVMIALGILAVGVLGMIAVQITAMKLSGDSRLKTQAAFLAQQQLETFQAMASSAVTAVGTGNDPGNPIDPYPTDQQAATFNRRWIVEPNTPEAGVIRITVEVDYVNNLGSTRTIRLQTFKAAT